MGDTRDRLRELWSTTEIEREGFEVHGHVSRFSKYALLVLLFTGIAGAVLVAALGPIGGVLMIPVSVYVGYKIVQKLFAEIDALVARRIRHREGELTRRLDETAVDGSDGENRNDG